MIALERQRLLVITPPHTASGNVHRALCSEEVGGKWVLQANPEGVFDHHGASSGGGWHGYTRAVVIRNPYDRLAGLYLHHKWAEQNTPDNLLRTGFSWAEFVGKVAADDYTSLGWFYRWSISRLLEFSGPIDSLIRFEYLREDISRLIGLPINLPDPYHESNPLNDWYADSSIASLVEKWAYTDCVKFGYAPPHRCLPEGEKLF